MVKIFKISFNQSKYTQFAMLVTRTVWLWNLKAGHQNNTKVSVYRSDINKCSIEKVRTIVVYCAKVKVLAFGIIKFQMTTMTIFEIAPSHSVMAV